MQVFFKIVFDSLCDTLQHRSDGVVNSFLTLLREGSYLRFCGEARMSASFARFARVLCASEEIDDIIEQGLAHILGEFFASETLGYACVCEKHYRCVRET